MLTPVSGFCIQKDEPGMYLVRWKIQSPNGNIAWDAHSKHRVAGRANSQIVPELAQILPPPWLREIYLREKAISVLRIVHLQPQPDLQDANRGFLCGNEVEFQYLCGLMNRNCTS